MQITTSAAATSALLAALGSGIVHAQSVTPKAIWSTGMETGDLRQWYSPCTLEGLRVAQFVWRSCGDQGGAESNNDGGADTRASRDFARSGSWSMKLSTPNNGTGTRMYRMNEPKVYDDLIYSVWYYLPQKYSDRVNNGAWANIWQVKSVSATRNDPFWLIGLGLNGGGQQALSIAWWHTNVEGPRPGQWGRKGWLSTQPAPIGKWFEVKVRYRCRGDYSGGVTVWQDGVQVFDQQGVRTRFADGNCEWSVNAYSEKMSPSPFVVYADDVSISRP